MRPITCALLLPSYYKEQKLIFFSSICLLQGLHLIALIFVLIYLPDSIFVVTSFTKELLNDLFAIVTNRFVRVQFNLFSWEFV